MAWGFGVAEGRWFFDGWTWTGALWQQSGLATSQKSAAVFSMDDTAATYYSRNRSEKSAAPAHVIFCAWDPAENMTCPPHTESHTVHGWMTSFASNISLSSAIDRGIPAISFNIHGCGAIWQLSPILSFCLKSMYCTLFFHSSQDLHSRALEQTAVSGTQQGYVGEKPCKNLCFLIGAEWSQCFKLKVRTNKFVTQRRSLVNTKVVTSLAINACIKQYRYQETLELLHRLPHNLFGENKHIYLWYII